MILTFNRAFDLVKNRQAAIETIIECNCDRILTSGRNANAYDGITLTPFTLILTLTPQ